MDKEEVSAGQRLTVGEVALIPIVRMAVGCHSGRRGLIGYAAKDVLGIVVVSPAGTHAMNVDGEEVPVEEFARLVPEIEDLLR